MQRLGSDQVPYKVVLLGEGSVGKTSLLGRLVNGTFSDDRSATVQASCLTKELDVDGQTVELCLWDTAGQERYHALGPLYYREAEAAVLVYDSTDADTFERVKAWVRELRQMVGPRILIAIAANKADLAGSQRAVSEMQLAAYAESIGAVHGSTSAKTGGDISPLFHELATKLLAARAAAAGAGGVTGVVPTSRRQQTLHVLDDAPSAQAARSSCCH